MMKLNKKAQNTLEYAVLIAVVAGALIAMQLYMKRAVQGHLQSSADDVGEQFSISGLDEMHYNATSNSTTKETFEDGLTKSVLQGTETGSEYFNVTLKNISREELK
jgi:Flp pilus assembly pilin Flp